MKNPHHHLIQLLHLICFICRLLILPPLLQPLLFVSLSSSIMIAPVLSLTSFSPEIIEDGLGLATTDHLLETFVLQLVAFEIDFLQLGAVAKTRGDVTELVI